MFATMLLVTISACAPDVRTARPPASVNARVQTREVTRRFGPELKPAIDVNKANAQLFEKVIQLGGADDARTKLADAYAVLGMPSVSAFYRMRSEPYKAVAAGAICTCGECDEPDVASKEVAQIIHPEAESDVRAQLARRRVELRRIINDLGETSDCFGLAEWADAVLELTSYSSADASIAEQERAIRLLIMLADDGGILPVGYSSAADVFIRISDYFARAGDSLDALDALTIAEARLNEGYADHDIGEATRRTIARLRSRLVAHSRQ